MTPASPPPDAGQTGAAPGSLSEKPHSGGPVIGTAVTQKSHYVVLTGNPNCGKTTLFNALTGLRAKVGNYAGVTVERKEGKLLGIPNDLSVRVLDLPGT